MKKHPFTHSCDWIAHFYQNAQVSAAREVPPARRLLPAGELTAIAGSLPAWQLGETSDGRHLRAAARSYAEAHNDPAFLSAVELFIREEQRHGAVLGTWLDAVGIPRKRRDWGDTLFRFCRYALPTYSVWAAVVVMVESLAELYYAAVRRLTSCPRLAAECSQILRDEVHHIRFQCEHLAMTRRTWPRELRAAVHAVEAVFYAGVCAAVWLAHGALFRAAGVSGGRFAVQAFRKFRVTRRLINPARYTFDVATTWTSAPRRRRLSELAALWFR